MQSVFVTSIYFCLPDENTKEATKPARPRTRGMLTMKPQQNKRLHTKHEPTNETTSRVKGRKNSRTTPSTRSPTPTPFPWMPASASSPSPKPPPPCSRRFSASKIPKVFIKRLGCCDEPVQQPRRSHICSCNGRRPPRPHYRPSGGQSKQIAVTRQPIRASEECSSCRIRRSARHHG